MRKIVYTFSMLCFGLLSSQVGINTNPPHGSSVFDMSDSKRGFLAPRVTLLSNTDTTTIANAKEGILVFNTTDNATLDPGYYSWNPTSLKWEPFYNVTNDVIQGTTPLMYASTLGYNPSGKSSTSPQTFSFGGVTATKTGCSPFTESFTGAPTHYYCGYALSATVDWEKAFNLSKFVEGYLVTITSADEWNFIKGNANLIASGGNANNNIWIGYNTIQYPGNPTEFTWISGEKSTINWSNSSTLQVNYAPAEPNTTTGCVRISPSTNANREWYNDNCNSTTLDGKPINFLIVEFNQ